MIIGYARVSTGRQNLEGQCEWLVRNFGAEKVFMETASGRGARPELEKLLSFARPGDAVVVQRLDRLARSVKELVSIFERAKELKLDVKSGAENLDTSTAGGKLIFHIFSAIAEFEANLIRERVMAGLENARAAGRIGGRPPKLTAKQTSDARKMINAGISARETAKRMNVSVSALYRHFQKSGLIDSPD